MKKLIVGLAVFGRDPVELTGSSQAFVRLSVVSCLMVIGVKRN